jgi:hypothetical protein
MFIFNLINHLPQPPTPSRRHNNQLLWIKRHAQLRPLNIPPPVACRESPLPIFFDRMHELVIDPGRSTRPRTAESIDGDPGEDLVVGPRVRVTPVMQFFIDPREQCHRARVQGVGEGLGIGPLEDAVALRVLDVAFSHVKTGMSAKNDCIPYYISLEPFCPLEAPSLQFCQRSGVVLGRWGSANEVEVIGLAAFWKE